MAAQKMLRRNMQGFATGYSQTQDAIQDYQLRRAQIDVYRAQAAAAYRVSPPVMNPLP